MTSHQKIQVRDALLFYWERGARKFRHGLCIGSDEQAAAIAKEIGYYVIAHPGYNPKKPENRMFRSDFDKNDEVLPEKPFIKRDHDIVDQSDEMIATPLSWEEQVRSGTWTTVRYARNKDKPIKICYPARDE